MRQSIRIVRRALNRARWVFALIVVNFVVTASIFSYSEGKPFSDGMWWAVVTGFTVGYGDFYPTTLTGKIAAEIFIVATFVLLAVASGHITAAILEDKNLFSNEEQEQHEAALLAITKHLGIVPGEFNELPSTDWWAAEIGFTSRNTE